MRLAFPVFDLLSSSSQYKQFAYEQWKDLAESMRSALAGAKHPRGYCIELVLAVCLEVYLTFNNLQFKGTQLTLGFMRNYLPMIVNVV